MTVVFLAAAFFSTPRERASVTPADGVGPVAAGPGALPPLPPLNPAPRIDVPPPPIEQDRITAFPYPLPHGVERPEVLARVRVTGRDVLGFGPDGTLYLTSNGSNIGTVRDGQLMWQYRLATDDDKFSLSPDGLIWIYDSVSGGRLFCFNSAGQGGEFIDHAAKQKYLPAIRKVLEPGPLPQCVNPGENQPDPAIEMPAAHGGRVWRTAVDQRCEHEPIVGRSGKILVQTQLRTVYLLLSDGRAQWTYAAPCTLDGVMLLADDTAVGRCSDRKTLLGIRDGQQKFSITSENGLSGPLSEDREGNFYRFASSEIYDRRALIKTNSKGEGIWIMDLRLPIEPKFAMGPDGKIYLLSGSPDGTSLMVIGDPPR